MVIVECFGVEDVDDVVVFDVVDDLCFVEELIYVVWVLNDVGL